ncbi:MAG: electron transport complex subunit RsxG [Methylophilaceae bacterium]|nr:electron transport complex subunit RsxG [Methylophilaceae bacterium]
MPKEIVKHAVKTAFVMVMFAIVGTAMLAYIYDVTKTPIAESEAQARMALFRQIVPETLHDNALLEDKIEIPAEPMLGHKSPSYVYRARMDGQPTAVILEAIAPDGYNGDIKVLVAIRVDGTIAGVRVLAHKETPGLGDYIDIGRSAWAKQFDGQSLTLTKPDLWTVKKDGGQFDYMAGATITPRAVIKAVRKVLEYYAIHHESVFAVEVIENEPETAIGAAS